MRGQQLLIFGGRLRARQQVSARQADIRRRHLPFRKIGFRHRAAGQRRGLEIAGGEVLLGRGFHLRGGLAERVAIGRVVGHAVAQVVEQHADLAVVIRVGHHQVDARPIQIGLGRRLPGGDADAVHLEGGEERDQAALEGRRHLRGVALQKEPRQFAIDLRRHRALLAEHDGVAVAALRDGRGGGPALGVLEDEDAHRQGSLQVVFADNLAERVAELLEAHHGLARGARAGVGHHFKRTAGELHPMIVRGQKPRDDEKQKQPPHALLLSRATGAAAWCCRRAAACRP